MPTLLKPSLASASIPRGFWLFSSGRPFAKLIPMSFFGQVLFWPSGQVVLWPKPFCGQVGNGPNLALVHSWQWSSSICIMLQPRRLAFLTWFLGLPGIVDFVGLGGPDHSRRWGAKHPTLWNGFGVRWGCPDQQNRRFLAQHHV